MGSSAAGVRGPLQFSVQPSAEGSPVVDGDLESLALFPEVPSALHGWFRLELAFEGGGRLAPILKIRASEMPGSADSTVLFTPGSRGKAEAVLKLYGIRSTFTVIYKRPGARLISAVLRPIGVTAAAVALARVGFPDLNAAAVLSFVVGSLRDSLTRGRLGFKASLRERLEANLRGEYYRRWVDFFDSGTSRRLPEVAGNGPSFSVLASSGDVDALEPELKKQSYSNWRVASDGPVDGDLLTWLGPGDQLAPDAFECLARFATARPEGQIFYSDEDLIDRNGRRSYPNFKPDWDPDYFRSRNFLSRMVCLRADLFRKAGGGIQRSGGRLWEYELLTRAVALCKDAEIVHVPSILCHRAVDPIGSKNPEEDELQAVRRLILGPSAAADGRSGNRLNYFPKSWPKVSALICTKDRVELLRDVVDGLLLQTDYPDVEVIIVDNQSSETATLDYLDSLRLKGKAKVIRYDHPFNFAAMNNLAAESATGEILLFLNNDLKVISAGWLKEMVSHALRPEIGAVGARLHFPDGSIQHAGVALGLGFGAGHPMRRAPREGWDPWGSLISVRRASAVTAACLAMRTKLFLEVRGFDAHAFAVAFNDVDLCLKIKAAGLAVLWTPYAELFHLESASRGADLEGPKLRRLMDESARLHARWGKFLDSDPYFNPNLALDSESWLPSFPPRV